MPKPTYNLHLKGYVGGYDFDSGYVDYVLAKSKDKSVSVLIDSLGGSLSTALSIAAAFRNHGQVSAHFCGMNASAATIASLGAKHISMDASAMYLVHKCSAPVIEWKSLNADQLAARILQLEQQKKDLEKFDLNVATMYASKCKKSRAELLDLMAVGGWLTAEEAKEWGFVDEIITDCAAAPVLTEALAADLVTAHIPLPNLPVADAIETTAEKPNASSLGKFFASLAALFKPADTTPSINQTQMTASMPESPSNFPTLSALNENAQFAPAADGSLTLTAQQAQLTEQTLTANAQRIVELTAQVQALQGSPADTTAHVVDNNAHKPTPEEKTVAEEYFETVASANKLYNEVV